MIPICVGLGHVWNRTDGFARKDFLAAEIAVIGENVNLFDAHRLLGHLRHL